MPDIAQPPPDLHSDAACLTSHVLDLATGRPAQGIAISLYRHDGAQRTRIASGHSNADGRLDAPLLTQDTAQPGRYTLDFAVKTGFFGIVPVEFEISDITKHHHVPLVLSPFGYSTYRGAPPHRAPLDRGKPVTPQGFSVPEGQAPAPGTDGAGITIHALDIANGTGAGGLRVTLLDQAGAQIADQRATAEGRTPAWLAPPGSLQRGTYELQFHTGDYYSALGHPVGPAPFFPLARVRFCVTDPDQHHHIPILTAPWGYSCYRGS